MEHRVSVHYTEQILRRAVRLYMWRGVLQARWWLWLCAVLLLSISLVAGWRSVTPVISGISIAALALIPVFFVAIWRAHFARTVGKFRSMTSPEADMIFRDSDLTITSTLGSVTLPWQRFVKTWEVPGFWMLFLAPDQFITLPLDPLSPDTARFVRSKLAPAGCGI